MSYDPPRPYRPHLVSPTVSRSSLIIKHSEWISHAHGSHPARRATIRCELHRLSPPGPTRPSARSIRARRGCLRKSWRPPLHFNITLLLLLLRLLSRHCLEEDQEDLRRCRNSLLLLLLLLLRRGDLPRLDRRRCTFRVRSPRRRCCRSSSNTLLRRNRICTLSKWEGESEFPTRFPLPAVLAPSRVMSEPPQ